MLKRVSQSAVVGCNCVYEELYKGLIWLNLGYRFLPWSRGFGAWEFRALFGFGFGVLRCKGPCLHETLFQL